MLLKLFADDAATSAAERALVDQLLSQRHAMEAPIDHVLELARANEDGPASRVLIRQLRGEAVDWQSEYAEHMQRGIDVFRSFVSAWYDGTLPKIIYSSPREGPVRRMICSVLAGYVWDETNPIVAQHQRKLAQLARMDFG